MNLQSITTSQLQGTNFRTSLCDGRGVGPRSNQQTYNLKNIVLSLVASLMLISAAGQDRPTHELHAAMLYNFIKYVQWPGESGSGEFVVGVMGEDNVYNTMKLWYDGKIKGSKKYVIKKLTSADEAGLCQVVYVGKNMNKEFLGIKANTTGKSILTITDGNGMGRKGSCINFKIVDGKLKFELNQATFNTSNLKVSGQLTSMAIVI